MVVKIPPEDDDLKISEMPLRNKLILTDQFPLIAGGKNYRAPLSQIKDLAVKGDMGPAGPPGPIGGVAHYAPTIAAMRALTKLAPGHIIYVGPQADQFIVVDDPLLDTDGGTVFIPNELLSPVQSHAITPWDYFHTAPDLPTDPLAAILFEYQLPHSGLDFESIQWVLSDPNATYPAGETLSIWNLHGHVFQPGWVERQYCQQLPLVLPGKGAIRDPSGIMTATDNIRYPFAAPLRSGGVLIKYRYATGPLRIKRVTGDVFHLNWWPVIATDEEASGHETDNTGKICWCMNAAAKAGASTVLIDKMYNYFGCVEIPDGLEIRGRGVGLSGFRVMKDGAYKELLLSSNRNPATKWKEYEYFIEAPATRHWTYDWWFLSRVTCFLPVSGAKRIRLVDLEWDGNLANNIGVFTKRGPSLPGNTHVPAGETSGIYAYGYSQEGYFWNVPTFCPFAATTQANRVVRNLSLELHNIKMHGYNHLLLCNYEVRVQATGLAEFGNTITGHFTYTADGDYEAVRLFGCCAGDGMRVNKFSCQSLEARLGSPPDVIFELAGGYPTKHPTDPNLAGPMGGDIYSGFEGIALITYGEWTTQSSNAALGSPWPQMIKNRISIDNLFVDATGLDIFPAGKTALQFTCVTGVMGDNIHIRSGKIRLPKNVASGRPIFSVNGNNPGGHPSVANTYENISIEYLSRGGQVLFSGINPGQVDFKNITIQPRAATHILNNPGAGISLLLGALATQEVIPAELPNSMFTDGGRKIEFAGAGNLNGDYIDITPSDTGTVPKFRVWFDYNSTGTAPSGTGVTLIKASVGATPTKAELAAAFSAAIEANATAKSYFTVATFGTHSVIDSYSSWQNTGFPTVVVTTATGVVKSMREARRNFEPSYMNFERVLAPDPLYMFLMSINTPGPGRDIRISFKDCVFGSALSAYITNEAHNGGFGTATVYNMRDRVHFNYENTVFDLRDEAGGWTNLDLMLYAGKFHGCKIRTEDVPTGLSRIGTGYETLVSEQGGMATWTPSGETTHDIQTKLFWRPKDGNLKIYPANAATAAIWNTVWPEWWRSSRPVGSAPLVMNPGVTPAGPYYSTGEDCRAPVLRLNFTAAPPATPLAVSWAAAVSQ